MDNFILKSILESTGADVAFSNGWRYGIPVVAGDITMNNLYNIVPTNPNIMTIDISGREIKQLIEQNIETTFSKNPYNHMGGYLKRTLGISVYFKLENPKGSRVQQIFFGDKKIEDKRIYKAAFITVQSVPKGYGEKREDTGIKMVDSLREYLKKHSPLDIGLNNTYIMI